MTDPNLPPGYQPPAGPAYQQNAYPQHAGYQQAGPGQGPARYNVLSIVSLVSAFFIPLAAIITGHIALGQIKRTGEQGRGLAIAGLVLGYLGVFVFLVALVALPALLAALSQVPIPSPTPAG
ncbi:MAG: hypothetical protein JWQ68_2267 [Cryobacterium sp.]|jgi:hypothetical protein|nr:hypothetical protein [Cryobacterium sp.]